VTPDLNHIVEKIKIKQGNGFEKTVTTTKKNHPNYSPCQTYNLQELDFPVISKE